MFECLRERESVCVCDGNYEEVLSLSISPNKPHVFLPTLKFENTHTCTHSYSVQEMAELDPASSVQDFHDVLAGIRSMTQFYGVPAEESERVIKVSESVYDQQCILRLKWQ